MGWTELVEGHKVDKTWQQSSAQRVFVETSDGTDRIPAWFAEHPDEDGLIVLEKHTDYYGGSPQIRKMTVNYGPDTLADGSETNPEPQDLPRSLDIGGEFYTIKDPSKWYWVDGDGEGQSVHANQPVFRRVVTGVLKVTKIVATLNLDQIIDYSGKLNEAPFPSNFDGVTPRAKGQWMFIAAPAEEFRNADGDKRWKVTYHFAFRTVTGINTSQKDGFEFIFRNDRMIWDRVNDSPSGLGNGVYEFADLNVLLEDESGSNGELGGEIGDTLDGGSVDGDGALE